jgi:NAD(P) transhydrogenase
LCDRGTGRVLGVQVLGEGATDLVHLGQSAITTGETAEFFVEQIFNFPTMTEAYRVAAFDVMKQRAAIATAPPALVRAAG